MNKRIIFSLTFTFIFLISVGTISAVVPNSGASAPNSEAQKIDLTEKYFIVKDFYGKIAVFENDSDEPIKITDSFISYLPEYDRQQLKNGVRADSEKELKRLLEDYCS